MCCCWCRRLLLLKGHRADHRIRLFVADTKDSVDGRERTAGRLARCPRARDRGSASSRGERFQSTPSNAVSGLVGVCVAETAPHAGITLILSGRRITFWYGPLLPMPCHRLLICSRPPHLRYMSQKNRKNFAYFRPFFSFIMIQRVLWRFKRKKTSAHLITYRLIPGTWDKDTRTHAPLAENTCREARN